MENKAYSKVGEEVNKFSLSGFVRYPILSLTSTKDKKPFVSFLITQYREAGDPSNRKKFSKTFQVVVFDEGLVDKLRVIDQQFKVEVYGNLGIRVEQVGAYRKSVPTLIATSVSITQELGIPFQQKGKPEGAESGIGTTTNPYKKPNIDEEIETLEKGFKKVEAKKSNAPVLEAADDDLPF